MTSEPFSTENDDGVCFSAGHTGAPFGAGYIHACLASDRKPPLVVAGISLGAVTAAVMEHSYRDLDKSHCEPARWRWYRRYLAVLLNRPYDVLWDAIPNPSDLLADLPPVQDPNLPLNNDPKLPPGQQKEVNPLAMKRDVESRRKLYIASVAARWLARLPVKVSTVAWILVRYVRFHEGYPKHPLLRFANCVALCSNLIGTAWLLLLHAARPFRVGEWHFRFENRQLKSKTWVRPLLGWPIWSAAFISCALMVGLGSINISLGIWETVARQRHHQYFHPVLLLLVVLWPVVVFILWKILETVHRPTSQRLFHKLARIVMGNLAIGQSFLNDFPLLLKLFRLFSEGGRPSKLSDCLFPVLLVAAPLQILPDTTRSSGVDGPNQLWPKRGDLSIVRALRACLAITPWFDPWVVAKDQEYDDREHWVRDPQRVERLDLVDGSAVRHNPLPAFLEFLKTAPATAKVLSRREARVHLVYDVPIRWKAEPPEITDDPRKDEAPLPDIVGTALAGLQLARRRDSRLEVIRTNYISDVERHLQAAVGQGWPSFVRTITVDEIAPEEDLNSRENLNPSETEILTHIAAGCRRSLAVLYQDKIQTETNCWDFIRGHAQKRQWDQILSPGVPGLPEVCRHCDRILKPADKAPDNLLPDAFRAGSGRLAATFPKLTGEEPRILFLASGGVFRGSFHIGMLGAMLTLNIKPNMIVGASVGSLIGAVLASIFRLKEQRGKDAARDQLNQLAMLFIRVDERVGLTKSFKGAVKDLGIRGRSSSLAVSPNQIRKMVKQGSRRDPGIAAAGAPPALIDAISDLFLIPYNATREIAAEFVAGHFSKAISTFLNQVSTETIQRLGIRDAVLGSTLIEREIREMLKDDLKDGIADPLEAMQPFLRDTGIALFATTVNLVTESISTLGADLDCRSYDFLEGLLASSAFPAAFAPRRASALFPGRGRRDIFYGDGGMFDNLPMLPALEVLSEMQKDHLRDADETWQAALKRRYDQPDLFLVGSLNTRQDAALHEKFDFVLKSWKRAQVLSDNEKIFGLDRAARKVDRMLEKAIKAPPADVPRESQKFMNGIVNGAILSVFPSDEEHLNGTFEFCRSLGLKTETVRSSIGDGCFETMLQLHKNQTAPNHELLSRALAASEKAGRIPRLRAAKPLKQKGICPYFQTTAGAIQCPFNDDSQIYQNCASDRTHQRLTRELAQKVQD